MRIIDWSSDVCSSDLTFSIRRLALVVSEQSFWKRVVALPHLANRVLMIDKGADKGFEYRCVGGQLQRAIHGRALGQLCLKELAFKMLGRASCRERVCQYV